MGGGREQYFHAAKLTQREFLPEFRPRGVPVTVSSRQHHAGDFDPCLITIRLARLGVDRRFKRFDLCPSAMYPRTSESRLVSARPTLSTGIERVVVEQGKADAQVMLRTGTTAA